MLRFSRLSSLLRNWLRRPSVERELDEEIRSYSELLTEEKTDRGLTREEARRAANIEMGGAEQVKQAVREQRAGAWLEGLAQDVRCGLRMLRKTPGFTVVAVLTLGLGIGANTAIFSVVYAALLRPLPYAQPSSLVELGETRQQDSKAADLSSAVVSYPDFLDWRKQATSFGSLAGYVSNETVLTRNGETEIVPLTQVTAKFFSTLGVRPILGRDFLAGEDQPSATRVVILSYGFWQSRFGGRRDTLGRTITTASGHTFVIVGILPRDFEFAPADAPLWVPLRPDGDLVSRRNLRWLSVVGRASTGTPAAQARAEMNQINSRLAEAYPKDNSSIVVVMAPLRELIVGQVKPLLLALLGAVALVLLIACANVGGLMLARSAGRRREFAIRAALGAGRRKLLRQLLVESLLLAGAGGALGLAWAQAGVEVLVGAIPAMRLQSMPYLTSARMDPAVLGFLMVASVATAILFGLIPALQVSRTNPGAELKEESRSATGTRKATRLRDLLVTGEIALSLTLLVGAGLMVRSMKALVGKSPGFDAQHLLTFSVSLPGKQYPDDASTVRFERQFTERLRHLPGVEGAGTVSLLPLSNSGNTIRFVVEGETVRLGEESECFIRSVDETYFQTMKIPLRAGRTFTPDDDAKGPRRVIVNQAFVNEYLGGGEPVGRRIRFTFSPKQPYREIVGVVGNVNVASLDTPSAPVIYTPFAQGGDSYFSYAVRTVVPPAAVESMVRAALRKIDSGVLLLEPSSMEAIIGNSPAVFLRRYPSLLIGSFAGLAVLLAAIGLYGLLAYSVAQQTNEMGIRLALGAEPGDLVRMVVGRGAKLALIGVGLGIGAALALTRLLGSLLYGVSALDPATFVAAAALLVFVALAACYIPARRATHIDPTAALRYE
jgi:predicted permease